jgi:IS5 family transposase
MTFQVNAYNFYKNVVIYTTVYKGNAYHSIHKRSHLTDEQAKKSFHREHNAEVLALLVQQAQNTLNL